MPPSRISETLVFLAFLLAFTCLYMWAFCIVVQLAWEAFKPPTSPAQPAQLRTRKIVLSIAAFGLLCMAYAYFIEPYWLEVKHIDLPTPKLPVGARDLNIVQISDLHCDPFPRLEERIPREIAALKPDLIVFTGDTINSPAGLPVFKRCLSRLSAIAPTIVIKGNWDSWYWKDLDRFAGTGARLLTDNSVTLNIKGMNIWVGGIDVGHKAAIPTLLKSIPPDSYTIFLHHYPHLIDEVAGRVDLYLSGHTHGGQVALPFYGALITLSPSGKKYESGLYHLKDTVLYVNRGIGMEGGEAPRFRFFARPEITVFHIRTSYDPQL